MAEPNSTPRNRKQAAKAEPITRHPVFPAIVALWFAALLGVGSLALSTTLLERLVLTTGIDTMIAAAAPPLGIKARLAVSLLFGILGAAIGWVLAKRVAEPTERRAPQVFKVAEVDPPRPIQPRPAKPEPVLDPASLVAEPIAAEAPELAPAPELPEPIAPTTELPDTVDLVAAEVTIEAEAEIVDVAPLVTEPFFVEPESREPTAAERIAAADLAELSHVELIERLAIALQRREALAEAAEPVAAEPGPVVQFPDFADRRNARQAPPASAPRLAPQETEMALRQALSQLQRMSGSRGG